MSTRTVYIPGGAVETPQFCSSDMSPQSLSPSHIQRAGMQRPVLAHWNWFGPHVGPAVDKYEYDACNYLSHRYSIQHGTPACLCPCVRLRALSRLAFLDGFSPKKPKRKS